MFMPEKTAFCQTLYENSGLKVPTLVIHGLADRMCDVSGGRATAEAIPGAELVLIEGMGHDMPPGLRSQLATRIADFVWRAERR